MYFKNRAHAGRLLLGKLLSTPFDKLNTIILALPRGGVPVAFEIAKGLKLPLDIVLVKKIGTPSNPELAIGAVSEGEEVYYNSELMKYFNYDLVDMEPFKLRALEELYKVKKELREGRPALSVEGKDIILVDDGIATGATMEVVIQLMKKRQARKIIVAAPIASPEVIQRLAAETDKVVSVIAPQFLNSVGQWYEDFNQVETSEVVNILKNYTLEREMNKTDRPNLSIS